MGSLVSHSLVAQLSEAHAEIKRLRAALQAISDIEDKMEGGDWDEIEDARLIARAAIRGHR